jgi:hypothetical protein
MFRVKDVLQLMIASRFAKDLLYSWRRIGGGQAPFESVQQIARRESDYHHLIRLLERPNPGSVAIAVAAGDT